MKLNLLNRGNKALKKAINQQLSIIQNNQQITIQGEFLDSSYQAKELHLQAREKETPDIKLAEIEPTAKFNFTFQLKQILPFIKDEEETILDCYLKIRKPVATIQEKEYEALKGQADFVKIDGIEYAEYFSRLGRFQNTTIQGVTTFCENGISGTLGITQKGSISFYFNNPIKPSIKNQIEKIATDEGKISIDGLLFTRNSKIITGQGVIKSRLDSKEYAAKATFMNLPEEEKKHYGLHRYHYHVEFETSTIVNEYIKDGVFDLYMDLSLDTYGVQETFRSRVGRPTRRVKLFLKDTYVEKEYFAGVIRPYFTFKASNLSFETWNFPKEDFEVLKNSLKNAKSIYKQNKHRDIWLVGERTYKAQDTGYRFFEYVRKKYPDKEIYYVIEKDSPEASNVEPLGNVLYFKSKEHIEKTMMATRIISSHHPDYLYPVRTKDYKSVVQGVKVFLQHGVMGTKNMIANYGKHSTSGFSTDVFFVSSEFEKDMIIGDFEYDEEEVVVTGLSRFDSLFRKDIPLKRQVLIIPTWRDWITSDEVFLESQYFERYKELVNSPVLQELSKKHGFEIIFCLHPNMQHFTHYFKDSSVRVISQGEVDVQHLIKESAIMITDYSSVAFDFSFLHKPIIYYQFDRNRFLGARPSHLNIEQDLPGVIVNEADGVFVELERYAKQDFKMEEQYIERANKFIKYRDEHSNDRIYAATQQAKKHKNQEFEKVMDKLGGLFRRNKYYFPVMKKAYKLMTKFVKVDPNLIFFESGVGKQYSDSPKYIYEEIVKRNLPYKKVWAYNNILPIKDRNTVRVKRLSPQYYYYLAKAGYWINNQNFPTYLDKRKETTYIQTWHGTPLKKMQFDIENIQGRDEGYLSRVYHATQQWTYLVSPSPYATSAFRSAFRYKGEILENGYPRNDIFHRPDVTILSDQIRSRLEIPKDKKVILYAPTFRDNQTSGKNKFVFELNFELDALKEALGDDYVLLLRMHVVVSNKISIPEEYQDFVYNVSEYPDIQELYLISDILMTDYSSVMFDFANTNRPILYYTYDLEDYRDNLRGFYFDFEGEAPGPLLKTTDDIINAVTNINTINQQYHEKYNAFRQKFCGLEDGKATTRIIDRFFDK